MGRQRSGETMTDTIEDGRHAAPGHLGRLGRNLFHTLPLVLVGSMSVGLGLTGPIEPVQAKPRTDTKPKAAPSELGKSVREAFAAATRAAANAGSTRAPVATIDTASAPTSYVVAGGDTVSSIAGRFGLATASVLALNGLGWKSVIHAGQQLKLTNGATPIAAAPAPAADASKYTIVSGDTLGRIASRFGVTLQTLLSVNGLGQSSIIYPGQSVTVPGAAMQSTSAVTPSASSAPTATSRYTIQSGDTVGKIASKFGVSPQALLDANGLGWSSIIYSGRSIVIPGGGTETTSLASTVIPSVPGLTEEMATNARTIVRVGRSLGVPNYGLVIALATAMQESGLRNLDYGDRDSLGLFQQRPSAGWGTAAQVRNTERSARLFFGGASNPNKGNTKGLLDIAGWQSKSVTAAAQAVQRSAFPNAYAKWETPARSWLAAL
ncbi:MAG: LysM peptidoglycan-binding protein [Microbacteriaceae bacterium]|nr:LysM peptidoglycan-binding protein [Microbacteriaceae bacterium]